MINRINFGRRVERCRKSMALSQAQLAEKLGVTAQAVSKWERGRALPDAELLLGLSRISGMPINALLEGESVIAQLADRAFTQEDIAYFVPRDEKSENRAWVREIVRDGWISRNWRECMRKNGGAAESCGQRAAAHGGIILEIGAGPGGGFAPYILKHSEGTPIRELIISDLSPTVAREWSKFLGGIDGLPDISCAAFNFCDIPFKEGSIDVISDGGGIGNTEDGDKGRALKEVCRVLKEDGLFITSTGFVTKETLAALPEHAREVLTEARPDVFADLYAETVAAGFGAIDSVISGRWDTDGDDSAIADLARSLGVNLHFTAYVRYCRKRAETAQTK